MIITIIATVCLGAFVAALLISRAKLLKERKELQEKFKVAQDYAEYAAKTNAQLTAANNAISAEVVTLKEATTAKSSTTPPPSHKNAKLKQASE